MERKWTEGQQKVISLRDRDLLVSAAAGSGKTAVLVERIIQKITDKRRPVDIDKLLVVTFTNAAAAEMRERIGLAIEKKLEKDPEDLHLQRQQTLLHNAQITTIHSFCLNVVRNYFHRIGLEPDFRVAEEGELKLLKNDVLAQSLERFYQEASPEFLALSETLDAGKDDRRLEGTVLRLFEFAMGNPWPEEWLEACREPFHVAEMEEFEQTPLAGELLGYLKDISGQWAMQLERCVQISLEEGGPYKYAEMLAQEADAAGALADCGTYRQFYEKMQGVSFGRLPRQGKNEGDVWKKEQVQARRKEVKDSIKKVTEKFFFQSPERMVEDIGKARAAADMLIDVTLAFSRAFSEKKREKNILDFSDQEHLALQILVDAKTREATPTAAEIRQGYEEIMVDEYQDSNYVQEAILKAVSKEPEGGHNRFMVGDVKQSIYRFRMARPELFMEKYNSYSLEDGLMQRVDLHKNFRSRLEVIQTVNDMFGKIMKADIGNITYDAQAALYPGAAYPVPEKESAGEEGGREARAEGFRTRFLVVEPESAGRKEGTGEGKKGRYISQQELEATAVGREIRRLMESQQVTDGESGKLRPLRYSDIAILLRSMKGWSDEFVSTLGKMGIPARAASGTGYFSSAEVQAALNMLRVIDNPRQDIPMAAVLSLPVVGLDGEELAAIRASCPDGPFYQAAMRCAAEEAEGGAAAQGPEGGAAAQGSEDGAAAQGPEGGVLLSDSGRRKLRDFFKLLGKYREKAKYTPIHELLSQLLDETGYAAYAYALPGGEVKRANLEMLVEKAISYEGTSYRGLFHFIRYIEQLQKYDVDYAVAESAGGEEIVRVMSIHKSKGLEFPLVFVSGLGRSFNNQDAREQVVLHPRLGIGLDVVDRERRTRTPGLTRQFLATKAALESLGEELRVLYVALTRAKERLILTGVMKKAEEKLGTIQADVMEDGFLPFLSRQGAGSFLQLLLLARAAKPERYPVAVAKQAELEAMGRVDAGKEGLTRVQILAELCKPEPEWEKKVGERLSYQYPYEAETAMRTKLSVSELKRRAVEQSPEEEEAERVDWARAEQARAPEGAKLQGAGKQPEETERPGRQGADGQPEEAERLGRQGADGHLEEAERPGRQGADGQPEETEKSERQDADGQPEEAEKSKRQDADGQPEEERDRYVPAFMKGKAEEESGAKRGTATHRILECYDFTRSPDTLQEQVAQMREQGRLGEDEAALVALRPLERFLRSRLGERMSQAAKRGKLWREKPFVMGKAARDVLEGSDSGEMILVQGIVDVFFEEPDGIVLLDYKTDRAETPEALARRYAMQLDLYQEAIERSFGKNVKEKLLYSFRFGKAIAVGKSE